MADTPLEELEALKLQLRVVESARDEWRDKHRETVERWSSVNLQLATAQRANARLQTQLAAFVERLQAAEKTLESERAHHAAKETYLAGSGEPRLQDITFLQGELAAAKADLFTCQNRIRALEQTLAVDNNKTESPPPAARDSVPLEVYEALRFQVEDLEEQLSTAKSYRATTKSQTLPRPSLRDKYRHWLIEKAVNLLRRL